MNNTAKLLDRTKPENWPFILNPANVMDITGMGKNKVLEMLQSGELGGGKRVRGRWLITRDSFLAWLKEAN